LIAGTTHSCFCSSVLDGDAHRQAAALGVDDLLGEHERGEVVAALAAVFLRLVEAEEAQLAHAGEHPVGEGRLLPLVLVGGEFLDHEVADGLPQLLVLVGEDEVTALGGEVRLQGLGGGRAHVRTVSRRGRKVNSGTSYFPLVRSFRMNSVKNRPLPVG
jgi:hypothetical protein